jgi:hypothetical protein
MAITTSAAPIVDTIRYLDVGIPITSPPQNAMRGTSVTVSGTAICDFVVEDDLGENSRGCPPSPVSPKWKCFLAVGPFNRPLALVLVARGRLVIYWDCHHKWYW